MTDERIKELWDGTEPDRSGMSSIHLFARAIERETLRGLMAEIQPEIALSDRCGHLLHVSWWQAFYDWLKVHAEAVPSKETTSHASR